MATRLGEAFIALTTRDETDKGLNAARVKINSWLRDITQGIAQGVGQAIAGAIGNTIRAGIDQIRTGIKSASDLNESLNKTTVAFADSSKEILEWSKTSATAFGQSQRQALEAASSFGLLFRTMGVTSEESAEMSKRLTELASDLASINNISPEEALIKLRAGLVGEVEPLRTVGVLLNAAVVEQKALALGLADTSKALSEQDKVMARYQLILEQTTLAQGDFARTSAELANAQRTLDAQIEDTSARLGRFLLPVQLAVTRGLSELITVIAPYGENIMDSLASGLARGITSILPVLQQVRALFVYWLKPGSPPRLLKELTDWGKSAMQEYLRGWTLADFDALQSVGSIMERVIRGFASSGDIKETDLVSRVFGSQKAMSQAIKEFKELGYVTEGTFGAIADSVGPAGTEVAELVRRYFDLQRATKGVSDAQNELNDITDKYSKALRPVNDQLDAVRGKQRELTENQELEELGKTIQDKRATASDRELARLRVEEIQLERQAEAISEERDVALDAAQQKIDVTKKEETAQQQKYAIAEQALDQQAKTNALIAEETTLRQRLIDEGLAEQKRVLAELEAEQRKAAAETERIADAQLRWQLASTDTAGQLAIMQEQLAKTTEGTAEYYDILTQIISLRERLDKEGAGGGGLLPALNEMVGDPAEVQATSQGIKDLSAALDEAFKTLAGGDGKTVELAPAWQTFADTLGTIGEAAEEVGPIIESIVKLIMGESVEGATGADPFADNWWLAGAVPGIQNIIKNLGLIRDGDWAGLWAGFKQYVDDVIAMDGNLDDGPYPWIRDVLIPALEALAVGEWQAAWDLLAAAPLNAIQGVLDKISELFSIEERVREFMEGMGFPTNPFEKDPGRMPQDVLPPSDFSSFPGGGFPGIAPMMPALATAGATSSMNNSNNNIFYISQEIGMGQDVGGARQGAAQGIREALIGRRLNGA